MENVAGPGKSTSEIALLQHVRVLRPFMIDFMWLMKVSFNCVKIPSHPDVGMMVRDA